MGHFGATILTAFSARFSKRLSRSFRRPLRGRVEERRFAGHEPLHSVDRRILVRRVGPGSVAQAHRHPWQLEVFVEGEGGHRAPARRPDLRLLPVRLDGLDRGLRDPRTRVGLRGAVRTVHLDPQVVISAFLQVGAQFAQRSFDRHVLDQSDVDLRVRLVREHRFRAAVFDVPRVNAADVHGRLEEVFQEELIFRQIELELRRPFLLKPGGRVERLREGLHHRGISLRRRDDIVPDSIDGRTLVLVDQGVERLQQPPDRGADPDCVRAVDFAVHRTAGLRVAAGPDREIQAPFHAQVDRGHAAQVLGVVVRDRRVRLQFSTVSPDVRDEIRATDLFLALREDLQVHRHLVDVADRLPGEEVVREGALRVRRAAADDRSADAGNVANLRGKGRRLPRLEVPDRLNVIHLVHDQGDGRAHVQLADDERMTAFRPGAGLAAGVRPMMADTGCKTRTWAKGGHPLVIGELDVGAPITLIVYEMYDVQPVGDLNAWQAPPFAAEIRDVPGVGKAIIGRGSTNSKGALANHLFTWKTIRDVDEMPVNLKILAEGEEEISSANFIAYIRTHRRELKADAAIANDYSEDLRGVPTIYLGVKGCLYLTVWSRGNPQAGGPMDSEIHSSNAVWIGSPVWRLLQALNTLVDEDQRPAIDGIWDDVVPPTKRDSAMVKTLAKTFDPSAWLQEERTAKFKFDLPKDELLLKYLFEPTVNICGIYSGYIEHGGTKTVLPHEAYAKIDIRLVKAMTVEATLRKLRDHLKKRGYDDLRIEVHGPYGPAKTDPESWIAKAAIEAVQANGKEPEVWPSSGGTMPAFAFDEYLKLPWVSTGLGHGSRAHAPNEYASIDGMRRFMAGEATLLYAAAKRAPKRHR